MRVSYQVDVRSRESSEFYSRHHDAQKDHAAVRAEIGGAFEASSHELPVLELKGPGAVHRVDTLEGHMVAVLDYWYMIVATLSLLSFYGVTSPELADGSTMYYGNSWLEPYDQELLPAYGCVEASRVGMAINSNDGTQMLEGGDIHIKVGGMGVSSCLVVVWGWRFKGTDVVAYSRRFQQLDLMCSRMFPEEIDKIEKYIGGLPDMIHGSVKASKPKKHAEAYRSTTGVDG
ncbi:hypothetical protein Tco_0178391 [Tanacetum coccineum]